MTLADRHDVALLDLDGVVYRGPDAVEHAIPALLEALRRGMRLSYVTNNAARTPAEVASHLSRLGLPAAAEDVFTSSVAAADVVLGMCGPAARVLAIGGPGVVSALRESGAVVEEAAAHHHPTSTAASAAFDAVVIGHGRDVSWRDLALASYAIAAGALFIATNLDATIPTPLGIAPGNGTFVAAVAAAVGRIPDAVAGKPARPLFDTAIRRTGAQAPLVIGDRLDTDIAGAVAVGAPSLLVLTGVSTRADARRSSDSERPTYIGADLRALHDPDIVAC